MTKIDVCPSKFAENLDHSLGALNYVLETASAKAHDVYKTEINNAERGEPAIVIAADTIIVSHDGRILEKPRSEADHLSMLKMLRDQGEHKVMTAVAVMRPLESAVEPGYAMETHVEETTVKFDPTGKRFFLVGIDGKLTRLSYRRTHPRIRQNTRRQRQSRWLRHPVWRIHTHRAHRRSV